MNCVILFLGFFSYIFAARSFVETPIRAVDEVRGGGGAVGLKGGGVGEGFWGGRGAGGMQGVWQGDEVGEGHVDWKQLNGDSGEEREFADGKGRGPDRVLH